MGSVKISETINELRKQKGLSIEELSNLAGVPKSTLSKITAGITKNPNLDTVQAIAKALGCTIDDFDNKETTNVSSNNSINNYEYQIINKYRELDNYGKKLVDNVLDLEHKRCTDIILIDKQEHDKGSLSFMKIIPLADVALSAGEGIEPLTDTTEGIEVDSRKYPKADIAFKVKGDSMETRYSDGDIVYVHSQPTLENGQIGAFLYNGEQYLKKYIIEDGKYILRSLNNKYKDIIISENDNFTVYGKVLN